MNQDLELIIHNLIVAGQTELATVLRNLEPKDKLQALILKTVASAVEEHGVEGMERVKDGLLSLIDGTPAYLDISDLRLASDVLAAMQRLEAKEKSAAKDMVTKVSAALAPIVSGLIGLLAR